jgi:3-oxoacyl-[acyl-carrier protein] reductase
MSDLKLHGKVALVTGSGRGLGKAIALRLASLGTHVIVHDLRHDTPKDFGEGQSIEEVTGAIRAMGRKAVTLVADLTDPEATRKMVAEATATFPHIDILVSNAGGDIAADGKSKANPNDMFIPDVDLDAVLDRNLLTVMNTCRAVVPNMLSRECPAHELRGRIVNLASIAGMTGIAREITYGVAKAGVIQYTRCLAAQLRPHGITVNAVAPGMIKSGRFLATLKHREGAAELLGEKRSLLRLGEPDDVARVVEFFVTDLAAYVTGQILRIDGGMQLFAS